ncbi:hypothetical protein BN1708_010017 [Verticillium longisporum]|uniref:Uncharacterized protein n=1 Tax=Verticillium longisporum TaxID=100787 RepID=A0A0G4KMS6_VERLO|nr:hypothetical protein BN1708_010017 [Verticillium longisporum]
MVHGDLVRIGMTPITSQQHLQLVAHSQMPFYNTSGPLVMLPRVGPLRRPMLVTAYPRTILSISPQATYDSVQSCPMSVLPDEAVRLTNYSGNSALSAPIG